MADSEMAEPLLYPEESVRAWNASVFDDGPAVGERDSLDAGDALPDLADEIRPRGGSSDDQEDDNDSGGSDLGDEDNDGPDVETGLLASVGSMGVSDTDPGPIDLDQAAISGSSSGSGSDTDDESDQDAVEQVLVRFDLAAAPTAAGERRLLVTVTAKTGDDQPDETVRVDRVVAADRPAALRDEVLRILRLTGTADGSAWFQFSPACLTALEC